MWPSGTIRAAGFSDPRGRRQRFYREYGPDGRMQLEAHYKDDVLHGVCREWGPSGRLLVEECYSNGLRCGLRWTPGEETYWDAGELVWLRRRDAFMAWSGSDLVTHLVYNGAGELIAWTRDSWRVRSAALLARTRL